MPAGKIFLKRKSSSLVAKVNFPLLRDTASVSLYLSFVANLVEKMFYRFLNTSMAAENIFDFGSDIFF